MPPHAAVTLSREQLCDVLAAVLALDTAIPRGLAQRVAMDVPASIAQHVQPSALRADSQRQPIAAGFRNPHETDALENAAAPGTPVNLRVTR